MSALEFGGRLDQALNGHTPWDDTDDRHCNDPGCWCHRYPEEPDYEAMAADWGWR